MPNLTARAKDAVVSGFKAVHRSDTWQNTATWLNTSLASLTHHTMQSSVWLEPLEADSLYTDDGIARRIVMEPVEAAFRQGWTLSPPAELDTDRAQSEERLILDRMAAVDAEPNLKQGEGWGRLYGRGGVMLGTADPAEQTAELVDSSVRDLEWTVVLKSSEFSVIELYTDQELDGQKFGTPRLWQVTRLNSSVQTVVHESRIILTRAVPTPDEMRQEHDWRDIPVLQAVYEDLRNYNSAKNGLAQMLLDASQAVLKIRNLAGLLADDPDEIRTRMRILEMARALHVMPIDAGDLSGQGAEDFFFAERGFAGVADAFDRMLGALSSSIGWPQTRLFGRSPAGENATGESDNVIWDDLIKADQSGVYLPHLQRLVTLAAYAEGVTDPEGWTAEFSPLRQETDAERVEREDKIADTDTKYIQAGVLDELDVQEHRFGGEQYNAQPVMVSAENSEAAKLLKEQDRDRIALGAAAFEEPEADVPAGPEAGGATSGAETIEKTMLNGAQLDKVIAALVMAGNRELPRESVLAYLEEFYPISPEAAKKVMGPIGDTWFAGDGEDEPEPAPVPPAFAAQQVEPPGEPVDEPVEGEDDDDE